MANLFYGVSTTADNATTKEVVIYNPESETMAPGDLLMVYFSNGNSVAAPSLSVSGISFSTGENTSVSLSSDPGHFIKTKDVTGDVDYMWQAGEVCLFALTSQQFNTDLIPDYSGSSQDASNTELLYELIRGTRANRQYYGLTRLFTGNNYAPEYDTEAWNDRGFYNWLAAGVGKENDKTTAATPYLVRKLAEFLIGKFSNVEPLDEPDGILPAPEESAAQQISYDPADMDDERATTIGTLTVGTAKYVIKIPPIEGIENTSQLFNDGDIYYNSQEQKYMHRRASRSYNYTYQLSTDTEYVSGTQYYEYDQETGEYNEVKSAAIWIAVPNTPESQAKNPSAEGWYETLQPNYYPTPDTQIKDGNYSKYRYIIEEDGIEPRAVQVTLKDFYDEVEPPTPQDDDPIESPKQLNLWEYNEQEGTFSRTQDDEWFNKTYYTHTPFEQVNPYELGWLEYRDYTSYVLTTDETYDIDKAYCYRVMESPVAKGWYEKTADNLYKIGDHFITDVTKRLYLHNPDNNVGLYVVNAPDPKTNEKPKYYDDVAGALTAKSIISKTQGSTPTTFVNYGFSTTPLRLYGKPIYIHTKGEDTIPTLTLGDDSNKQHTSTLTIAAPVFKEDGQALTNRYAHHLVTKLVRIGAEGNWSLYEGSGFVRKKGAGKCITLNASKTSSIIQDIEIPGYKPLGVVGYNITYALKNSGYYNSKSQNNDATFQNLWECYVYNVATKSTTAKGKYGTCKLKCRTRNLASRTTYFFIDVRILCEKII